MDLSDAYQAVSVVLYEHQWAGTGAPTDEADCCAKLAVDEVAKRYHLVRKPEPCPATSLYCEQGGDMYYNDPDTLVEGFVEQEYDELTIEVHSAKGVTDYLPTLDRVAEALTEGYLIDEEFLESSDDGQAHDAVTKAMKVPEVAAAFGAADAIAKRLESTAQDIRRRSVRSSLDYERRGILDASGYAADIMHDLQSMQGNLSVERLVRAARDFENVLREEQAKLEGGA